jgi:hypothetical protein
MPETFEGAVAVTHVPADLLGEKWLELDREQEKLDKRREKLKPRILAMVREYGQYVPKSKTLLILRGLVVELRATFPEESVIDETLLRQLFRKHRRTRELFTRHERFSLRPGAVEHLLPKLSHAAMKLFFRAVTRRELAPRVKVVKRKRVKKSRRAA